MTYNTSPDFLWTPQAANELAESLPMDLDHMYEGVAERVPLPAFRTNIDYLVRVGRVATKALNFLWILDALPNQAQLRHTPGVHEFNCGSPFDVAESGRQALKHGVVVPGENGEDVWVMPTDRRILDIPFNRILGVTKDMSELPEGAQPVRLRLATAPAISAE